MFVVATLRGVGVTERLGGSQTPGDNQLIKYPSCCSGLATNIWSDPTHHFSNFPAWVPVEEQLYFIILLAVADISQPATSWQNLTAVTSNPWHWKPNLSSGLFQLVDETLGRPLPCIFRKAKGSHNTFLPRFLGLNSLNKCAARYLWTQTSNLLRTVLPTRISDNGPACSCWPPPTLAKVWAGGESEQVWLANLLSKLQTPSKKLRHFHPRLVPIVTSGEMQRVQI